MIISFHKYLKVYIFVHISDVMPARHEDTQDHGKQQLFNNLSSFPNLAPLQARAGGGREGA